MFGSWTMKIIYCEASIGIIGVVAFLEANAGVSLLFCGDGAVLARAELIIDFAPLWDSKELRSIFVAGTARPSINAAIAMTTVISVSVTPARPEHQSEGLVVSGVERIVCVYFSFYFTFVISSSVSNYFSGPAEVITGNVLLAESL